MNKIQTTISALINYADAREEEIQTAIAQATNLSIEDPEGFVSIVVSHFIGKNRND